MTWEWKKPYVVQNLMNMVLVMPDRKITQICPNLPVTPEHKKGNLPKEVVYLLNTLFTRRITEYPEFLVMKDQTSNESREGYSIGVFEQKVSKSKCASYLKYLLHTNRSIYVLSLESQDITFELHVAPAGPCNEVNECKYGFQQLTSFTYTRALSSMSCSLLPFISIIQTIISDVNTKMETSAICISTTTKKGKRKVRIYFDSIYSIY